MEACEENSATFVHTNWFNSIFSPNNGWLGPQISPWMCSRDWSDPWHNMCTLNLMNRKVLAHAEHYQWNCIICNMSYGLDVHVVQFQTIERVLFQISSSIGLTPVEVYISSWRIFNMEIFSQIYRIDTILFYIRVLIQHIVIYNIYVLWQHHKWTWIRRSGDSGTSQSLQTCALRHTQPSCSPCS